MYFLFIQVVFFSIGCILIIIFFSFSFNKLFYNICFGIDSLLFLTNVIYFNKTNNMFSFRLLDSFSEYPDLSYRDKNGLHSIIDKPYLDEKVKQNDLTLLSNYFK